jgi:hypothetical protein
VNSRVVNKEIRERVWSGLKEQGFEKRTTRTAWRHWKDGVDVVNFQSFNSYNAGVLGCTTFSFAVNLGIWLLYIPASAGEPKREDGEVLPQEYQCPLRRSLRKSLTQPEFPREEIWYVREDGSNVTEVVADAANVLRSEAHNWFERFRDAEEVLRTLREDSETMEGSWGFGREGSPVRHYLTGYAAVHVGQYEVATSSFQALLESGVMDEVHPRVREALEALRQRA